MNTQLENLLNIASNMSLEEYNKLYQEVKELEEKENFVYYEIFEDLSYYHLICIRPIGNKNFNETIHVQSVKEAINYIDNMIK